MTEQNNIYKKTASFWDQTFSKIPDFDPENPLAIAELENSLKWLGKENPRVLDFGCGHGKILLRSQSLGVKEGIGLDISREATEKGNKIAQNYKLGEKFRFLIGGIPELKQFPDGFFQGIIIFNVLDNLIPPHGELLIEETKRLLSPEGKVLLKLNPFFEPQEAQEVFKDSIQLEKDLFLEPSGLYFWNISPVKIRKLLEPTLEIHKEIEVSQGEKAPKNRVLYIQKI